MAKFNVEIYDLIKLEDSDYKQAAVYLQALLSKEELSRLKEDWDANGGYHVIPLWKYVFDNVTVSYK